MSTQPVRQFLSVVLPAVLALVAGASPLAAQSQPKVLQTGIEGLPRRSSSATASSITTTACTTISSLLLRSADANAKFRATSATISGSGADWHDVESYFRPNAIGTYSFDANNNVVFNKLDRLFDLAIMMDCSQCPIHPQLKSVFAEFSKKHSATVRKHGAVPVYFMSWAYADKPEMTAELAEAYTRAGNDDGVFVVPVGLAFAKSIERRPELNLYAADKRHPSMAGTYLAATTLYAALFKTSPVGLKYAAGLDDATAKHLQTVAWDTVQDYFGTAVSAK